MYPFALFNDGFLFSLFCGRIRPSESVLQLKREKLMEIEEEWETFLDYILHTVFLRTCAMEALTGGILSSQICSDADRISICVADSGSANRSESSAHLSTLIKEGNMTIKKKRVLNRALYDVSRVHVEEGAFHDEYRLDIGENVVLIGLDQDTVGTEVLRLEFGPNSFPYDLHLGSHWVRYHQTSVFTSKYSTA
jgi:hypothetical protein